MRSPFRVTPRYIDFLFNREETVVTREPFWWPMVAPPLPVEEEGAWQLPPSDESKVGDD